MPNENNKISKKNHGEKPMYAPFIIYADLESFLLKIATYCNNSSESSTTKINKHTSSVYSLFTPCSFDTTKNGLDCDRRENCMKNICVDLTYHKNNHL